MCINHKYCKNRWSRHSSILESSTYVNMRHKALHRLRNGATFVPGKLIAKFVSAARSGGSRGCPGCPAVVKLLSKRWWIPIQARGLTGREQRWGSPTADQGFSSIQGTLVGFHCLWRLQHPSAPSMDKCKWQDDCEGLHFLQNIMHTWSVIIGSGSQIRGAGSEIRWDPSQFNPWCPDTRPFV